MVKPLFLSFLDEIMNQTIQGYYYKTVPIRTSAGVYKYNINVGLSDAGLPEGAIVLGIYLRQYDDGTGTVPYSSLSNTRLVNNTVFQGSFITLKDKFTKTIVSQYHLPRLVEDPFMFDAKKKNEVDWNNSYIEISTTVASGSIVNGECFEFIIIYTLDCGTIIDRSWEFRTGEYFEKARFKLIYIPTQTGTQTYPLAPSVNVGIEEDSLLIGMDFNMPPVNYRDLSRPQKSSAYFDLIRGSLFLLNTIPVAQSLMGKPRAQFQREYLPIVPTRIGDIDWQGSQINFTDPAAPTSGRAIALGLIYVTK